MNTLLECLIILCSKIYALFECLVRTHIFHCKYLVCIFEFVLHRRHSFFLNYMHKMNEYFAQISYHTLFEILCFVRMPCSNTHFHCKYLVCIFEFVLHQRPCFLLNYMHKMNKYLKLGFFFRYVSAEYAFITVGIYKYV